MHPRRASSASDPTVGAMLVLVALLLAVQSFTLFTAVSVEGPAPNNVQDLPDLFDAERAGDAGWWEHQLDQRLHHTPQSPTPAAVIEVPTGAPQMQHADQEAATRAALKVTKAPVVAEVSPSPAPSTITPAPPTTAAPPTLALLDDVDAAPTALVHLKDAALLVLCYNRPTMLSRSLARINKAALSADIKKYVSQDGAEPETRAVAKGAAGFEYMSHPRTLPETLQLNSTLPDRQSKDTPGTMYLAAHYRWALDEVLFKGGHSHAIIVEDDLSVSSDFFAFFEQLAPVLDADPTLWCVSTWNDNGFGAMLDLPRDQVFRSSYFPGLGWMLSRKMWAELRDKWPDDNWDHWMRVSSTHKGRSCLVPFLSRNRNMGDSGATASAEFYDKFLKNVASLKDHDVREKGVPVIRHPRHLLADAYDAELRQAMSAAEVVMPALATPNAATFHAGGHYVVPYLSEEFEMLATMFKLHPFPRTHYRHVTWLQFGRAHVFLVNRRLSPFTPEAHKVGRAVALTPVRASSTNQNCHETCRKFGDGIAEPWHCGEDQFDFINDCEVLADHFDGCPYGCTQEWGEDIPNMQSWDIGSKPQCLVTEMHPRCEAKHPLTTRLCPCVAEAGKRHAAAKQHPRLDVVAAAAADDSCNSVCANHHKHAPDAFRCDDTQFGFLNSCRVLKENFGCASCGHSKGNDLPNFVVQEGDPNHGKCLLFPNSGIATCFGSNAATRRLCPCVPVEGAEADARGR